jgi:hypothetical protein
MKIGFFTILTPRLCVDVGLRRIGAAFSCLNHYSRATTPRAIMHMACRALESKETTCCRRNVGSKRVAAEDLQ